MSKRIIASFTLFGFLSLAAPVYAIPAESNTASPVTVERAWGNVVARDGNVQNGVALGYGQTVKVGEESGVTLLYPNGTRVRISPNSEFRVTSNAGEPQVYLLTGKILASVTGQTEIATYRTNAVATTGEFVLTSSPTGTDLQVLSGNARMASAKEDVTTYHKLAALPGKLAENALLAFGHLNSHQSVGEANFGAAADGPDRSNRAAPDVEEAPTEDYSDERRDQLSKGLRPDQDITGPGQKPGAATTTTTTTTPSTTTTTTTTTTTAAGGGGSPWPWVIGGLAGLGAIIAIASDNEDGGDQNFDNVNVPSPSFP